MNHTPVVSVIIPFYNAEDTLPICIEALLVQTMRSKEIIFVDNNSTDQSSEIARRVVDQHPNLFQCVFESKQGAACARNRGVKLAKGEIICFIDADCAPERNWLEEIVKPFENPLIGAVAGQVLGFGAQSIFDKFHHIFTLKGLKESQILTEFSLISEGFATANLSVRKTVLSLIGGFDEAFTKSAEDHDLCARIYKAGFSIQYINRAKVRHKHRNGLLATWRQSFGFGVGHSLLLGKHFRRMFIVELPRFHYLSKKWSVRIWLDMKSADKKLLALILISLFWWPLSAVLFCYLVFLLLNMNSRLHQAGLSACFREKLLLILLLFVKSLAITAGRVRGSMSCKVLCF